MDCAASDHKSCMNKRGGQIKHGYARRGHKHPLYETWLSMRQRCTNPRKRAYQYYGGRGIFVCVRWNSFRNFLIDMEASYRVGLELERKDNDGPYCAENCRWATRKEQSNNSRNNRRITFDGQCLTLTQWANRLGAKTGLLNDRIDRLGWPIALALTTPVNHNYDIGRKRRC